MSSSSSNSNKSVNSNRTITLIRVNTILKKAGLPKYVRTGRGRSVEGYFLNRSLDGLLTLRWEVSVSFASTSAFDIVSHTGRKIGECQKALQEAGIQSVLKAGRLTLIYPDPDCEADFEPEFATRGGEDNPNSSPGETGEANTHNTETGTPPPVPVFEVANHKCPTCIFSSHTPIPMPRFKEHLEQILATDGYAICHHAQFTKGQESQICCRGFFEVYGSTSFTPRLARYLGIVKEVEL